MDTCQDGSFTPVQRHLDPGYVLEARAATSRAMDLTDNAIRNLLQPNVFPTIASLVPSTVNGVRDLSPTRPQRRRKGRPRKVTSPCVSPTPTPAPSRPQTPAPGIAHPYARYATATAAPSAPLIPPAYGLPSATVTQHWDLPASVPTIVPGQSQTGSLLDAVICTNCSYMLLIKGLKEYKVWRGPLPTNFPASPLN